MSLQVKVVNALLTRDVGSISQMDPYVKLHLGNQKFCTSVHKDGGKKPKWNQTFRFDSFSLTENYNMKLYIMDQGGVTDTLIAAQDINLKTIVQDAQKNGHQKVFDVIYDGKSAGKIMLRIQSSLGASKASTIENKYQVMYKKQEASEQNSGKTKDINTGQIENNIESTNSQNPMNLWQSLFQGNSQVNGQHMNMDPNQPHHQNYHYQGQYNQGLAPQPGMYNPQQYVNPQQNSYIPPHPSYQGVGHGYPHSQQMGYVPQQMAYQQPQVIYTTQPNYSQNPLNSSVNSWGQPNSWNSWSQPAKKM